MAGLRREPTARQVRLGVELRRLRDAAGLTGREAATSLGVSSAQINQIESALSGVSEKRLRRLAAIYACTDEEVSAALVAMATDRTRGWWEEYRGSLPTSFLGGTAAAGGIALINSLGNLGGYVGPQMVGYLKDKTHGFEVPLLSVAAIVIFGALSVTQLKHDRSLEHGDTHGEAPAVKAA